MKNENMVAIAPPSDEELALFEKISKHFVDCKFFRIETVSQGVALMCIGHAQGIHPVRALMEYNIIHDNPVMKAETVLARYQDAGGRVEWIETTATRCDARFIHPQGEIQVVWDLERAAPLMTKKGKDGQMKKSVPWRDHPAQMLRARAAGEGVRATFPSCLSNMYLAEELPPEEKTAAAEQVNEQTGEITTQAAPPAEPETPPRQSKKTPPPPPEPYTLPWAEMEIATLASNRNARVADLEKWKAKHITAIGQTMTQIDRAKVTKFFNTAVHDLRTRLAQNAQNEQQANQ